MRQIHGAIIQENPTVWEVSVRHTVPGRTDLDYCIGYGGSFEKARLEALTRMIETPGSA